ncbi:SDR family oxidoreductase [Paraburkholderia sp. LEh10]|uniref:SDR family NAD(P)-dependent oxidoreductase n=1 Tax=Paraburkholderia sp. LEh10 TaxID=2821353 RepID=UPI001AE9419D|nr:glucose 1-dehydrogenase [Paraburkholderia sp. LEh10]MBP0590437.1 SDR family oxidoreductase [Paraburkholderia sp. LEh10]
MERYLSGKVALVTGASSGIGRATALLFAQRDAHVAIAARRVEALDSVVEEIERFGGSAAAFPTDVSQPAEVEALIENVVARFGRLDAAFNNAGIMGAWGEIGDHTVANFDDVIDTNLRGTWLCCKAEIARMKQQDHGGAIVNTSSWLARGAFPGSTLYTMSKAGMDGMARALALETGSSGIRVNNVNPGIIDTEMLRNSTTDETRKPFLAHTPMKRVGTSDEVAEAVVWLCSDASRFVTGQTILIDGGYTIPGNRP